MGEPIETSHVLRFGMFEFNARARELRKQGVRIKLQEQPFQVLSSLLEHADQVVTRDQLRQKVWPSNVYVDFDHRLNNAIARLREVLGDVAGTSRFIETVPRVGYRFIHPVEVVPLAPRAVEETRANESPLLAPALSEPIVTPRRWSARQRALVGGIGGVVIVSLIAAGWIAWQRADETGAANLPTEPSIAVLPFVNMSDDVEKEHFADGLSEELLNKLAAIRGLNVVGRTSSFYFKNKRATPSEIAAALKVSHLLEGSVRRSGSRVRVTAQLVDARNGYHLWSQTYDREFNDIFQVQDDIAHAVAAALQVKLMDADEMRLRRRGTRDIEAYRLYLIGVTLLRGHMVDRDKNSAKGFFERALARDPGFAAAQAGIAMVYFGGLWSDFDGTEQDVALGREAAERAVALDPESSEAFVAKANFDSWRYRFRGDSRALARAGEDYRHAIELDPSNSNAYFNYARAIEWTEPDFAVRLFERTAELDPLWDMALARNAQLLSRRGLHDAAIKRLHELDTQGFGGFAMGMGLLERQVGHLDAAVQWLRASDSIERGILLWSSHMSLGDGAAALQDLEAFPETELARNLQEAARLSMDGRFDEAYKSLDRNSGQYPVSHVLDVPTARYALITGRAARARELLEQRLPDLTNGRDRVTAANVIPALDLAAAWAATGDKPTARQLMGRIVAFLEGPDVPRLPMFTYFRARAHALANEPELALQVLDRAFREGFRLFWALDLNPAPYLYIDPIDADPAFASLKGDPRFKNWRERIVADNARQLASLKARMAASPSNEK